LINAKYIFLDKDVRIKADQNNINWYFINKKMSYVIRNPKDVAVSSYFFFSAQKREPIRMDIQEYLELFLEGKGC